MSAESISQAIQDTALFTAMRESMLVYPIVMSTHLTSIAVFGGLILITDLRLLGVAMRSMTVSDVVRQTRIFKWIGFIIMVTCGVLLAGSKLATYYDNPYFLIKLFLLALVPVHALIFRRSVYRNTAQLDGLDVMPRVAKIAACTSLLLWLGILSAGRWIGYYDRPQQSQHTSAAQSISMPSR